jgi:hypothetical protein
LKIELKHPTATSYEMDLLTLLFILGLLIVFAFCIGYGLTLGHELYYVMVGG